MAKSPRTVFALLLVLLSALCVREACAEQHQAQEGIRTAGNARGSGTIWEISLAFHDSLEVRSVRRLAARGRRPVHAPHAPLTLSYRAQWLDAQRRVVFSAPFEVPLGVRASPAGSHGCETHFSPSGGVTVRIPGPHVSAGAIGFRVRGRGVQAELLSVAGTQEKPASRAFQRQRFLRLPTAKVAHAALHDEIPAQLHALRESGAAAERLSLVIISDGYQKNELSKFAEDSERVLRHFEATDPWSELLPLINVYRIDVASRESGADIPPHGVSADTYFNSSYWTGGIERLLTIDSEGSERARSLANRFLGADGWDQILVLVNSEHYGGSGGELLVSSTHPAAPDIVLHELGHSFANLADEYGSGTPARGFEASKANVEVDAVNPKWAAWLTPGVALPTRLQDALQETSEIIGAFEGANYHDFGLYRPSHRCAMRELGAKFCAVCREAHVRAMAAKVPFVRSKSAASEVVALSRRGPLAFGVEPLEFFRQNLSYRWSLCGKALVSERSPETELQASRLTSARCELKLEVTYHSPHVRSYEMKQVLTWTVQKPKKKPARQRMRAGHAGYRGEGTLRYSQPV